jgi:hypothetical protein
LQTSQYLSQRVADDEHEDSSSSQHALSLLGPSFVQRHELPLQAFANEQVCCEPELDPPELEPLLELEPPELELLVPSLLQARRRESAEKRRAVRIVG